jgi:DmsE family decaheme c-type cytochrome
VKKVTNKRLPLLGKDDKISENRLLVGETMGRKYRKFTLLIGPAAALIGLLVLTFTLLPAQEKPSDDDCLLCHDTMAASLKGSVHQLTSQGKEATLTVSCADCHKGGANHMDDPSVDNIGSPARMNPADQAEVCASCHTTEHQEAMISTDPHGEAGLGCVDCHKVHGNQNRALVKDDGDNYCKTCHTNVALQFMRRSSHPFDAGVLSCVSCHDVGSVQDPLRQVGLDWRCQSCHPEQAGPYPFEHEVVYDYRVNGGGCVECHQPHGSSNDRLLNQPGNGTCNYCHGVPPLHRTMHSGLGSKLACVDCHSDIHGSYSNRLFLDPDLGTKLFPDCYQSGCHADVIGN